MEYSHTEKNKQMRKITLLTIFALGGLSLNAQNLSYPRIGVGLQANFHGGGLSAKVDITEKHSAQLIIDVFGRFTSYTGRYLYNFNENGNEFRYKPYVFGQMGVFNYDYRPNHPLLLKDRDSVFGLGVGGGLEVHYTPFTDRVRLNVELGYNTAEFDFYDYDPIFFSIGLHYYFKI